MNRLTINQTKNYKINYIFETYINSKRNKVNFI